jgi:hypothetical protein
MLKHAGHLVRLAGVLAIGLIAFLSVRAAIVPKGFGKYGHYRAPSLEEIRARPIHFAGRETCEACHSEVAEVKNKGRHAGVGCEACHGPSAEHTEDPTGHKAAKPDVAKLCVRCHEADPAKPKAFPQVISAEHAGEVTCNTCHQPHSPKP